MLWKHRWRTYSRSDHHALDILKQFSLRLDALKENLEATDNAPNADKIEAGSCVMNMWEILKHELKSQFFLENTAFSARKALLECKHTGSVREYCQAFSALIVDISDMSTVDILFFFFFMEGLKPWARTELNKCRVNNLNDAFFDSIGHMQRGEQSGSQSRQPPTDEQLDT
ncbi:hypothetical protein RJ639_032378 [Escallonia herrerae]|uniref:Retrotransposon gag domain-containing protein n=1 Tax=Escallonia herrerae TaxID=1293975 RepID=A0AA89B9H6_9ASTE|nr:hypothetical protein RJ639_032378 [Escallonia herrerae]